MFDSLPPHGLSPTRLLHPWDFPGKSTGVGCHFLLRGIFVTQGLNPGLTHCRQMLYIYMCVCVCVCILFKIFFTIMAYNRILNVVLYAIQVDLCYLSISHIITYNCYPKPLTSLHTGNHKSVLYVYNSVSVS